MTEEHKEENTQQTQPAADVAAIEERARRFEAQAIDAQKAA